MDAHRPANNGANRPAISKASIRQRIWDYLEKNHLANFPRPVHHRIPNFKGAAAAAEKLKELDAFHKAKTIKVNPDKPQEHARFLTLEARKTLLVPTPRLRTGLFNRIVPPTNPNKEQLRKCATSQGVKQFSVPIGLDDAVKIDLIIIGSVAVSPKGHRIGKGEGYADLEYAMMVTMGAVTMDTIVISTVHDCQVLDDIPEDLFGPHDLMVDCIITPTRIIQCRRQGNAHITKPSGIFWQVLTREKFNQIPILKTLRYREQKAGKDVRLKDEIESSHDHMSEVRDQRSEIDSDKRNASPETNTNSTEGRIKSNFNDKAPSRGAYSQHQNISLPKSSRPKQTAPDNENLRAKRVFVGGIPRGLRLKDFKHTVRESGVDPSHVAWHGGRGFAFLQFKSEDDVKNAVKKLNGMSVLDKTVRAEVAHE